MRMIPVITVDGPSGTGKGTVCACLARLLGWDLLDSGALYRILAYAAHSRGITMDDGVALAALVPVLNVCFRSIDGRQIILLDGQDISDLVRTEQCGGMASQLAALPEVRAALLAWQRGFLKRPGLIADGRDMGTTVFPDAPVKIYLTASLEERAKRRYKQLRKKAIDVNLDTVLADMEARDGRDRWRDISPLKSADDALVIDTTYREVDTIITEIKTHIEQVCPEVADNIVNCI